MEQQLYLLQRNPMFERLVVPLNSVERKDMEEEININGGIKGVRAWKNMILVDYEYYDYCHRMNIPFCLHSIDLETETEAVAWVCRNQIFRKSLPEEMRKYLIGKRSLAEKLIALRNLEKLGHIQQSFTMSFATQTFSQRHIRERVGAEYNITGATVEKYEAYVDAVDTIRGLSPGFAEEHLAGKLKMSFEKIGMLASLPVEALYRECQRWLSEPVERKMERKKGKYPWDPHGKRSVSKPSVSIKDMPAYDPDAEIVSLALTIPSWQSSITHVKETMNIKETSQETRLSLIEALISLNTTVYRMIRYLKEG